MADIVYTGQAAGTPLNSGALPANTDLVIYKGDYVRLKLTITDSSSDPVNLADAEPAAVLKSDYTDRSPKPFVCTVVGDGSTGEVQVFMSSAITSQLLPGSYIWDFQITFDDNETRTYLAGDVTVYNEVTD